MSDPKSPPEHPIDAVASGAMPADYVSREEIAARLKIVKQRVAQLAETEGFPSPISVKHAGRRFPVEVYLWSAVASWCRRHDYRVEELEAWERSAGAGSS